METMDLDAIRGERAELLVLTPEHIRCLVSIVRSQIYSIIEAQGPCSAPDLAEKLDTYAEGLYHHIKKMVGAGLLREVGIRRRGTRDEAVYDVLAQNSLLKPRPWDADYIAAWTKFAKTEFRRTFIQYEGATEAFGGEAADSTYLYMRTITCQLSPAKIVELRARLKELDLWLAEDCTEPSVTHAFFMVMHPLVLEGIVDASGGD
jgi:hypothetical protein